MKVAFSKPSASVMFDVDAVRVSPTCAVPLTLGSPTGRLFSGCSAGVPRVSVRLVIFLYVLITHTAVFVYVDQ